MAREEILRESTAQVQEGATNAEDEKPNQRGREASSSRQFTGWLREQNVSVAFTTYQANKLYLIGRDDRGRPALHRRNMARCMGMYAHGSSLFVSTIYQLWRFEDIVASSERDGPYDRRYVPQVGYITGDIDVHDISLDREGRILFISSLYSCLATVSNTRSLKPLWMPKFVTKLAAEDRCHLNGLAMRDGRPAWVTAIAQCDATGSWREHRRNGGCVIDIASNEIVVTGLSMPHSPRWYRDRLWLHNSGTGEFGYIELDEARFVPVCFCPGYLRGLDFVGKFAVVGLSRPRGGHLFEGLELQSALDEKKARAQSGVFIIDLDSGDIVHWLNMEDPVQELYDVAVLENCRRPVAVGFQSDEIHRVLTIDEWGEL